MSLVSSVAIAQEVDKLPDCASGQGLMLRDNGWLVSPDLQNVASHHEILGEDYRQPGIPDTLRYSAERSDKQIFVCRVMNKVHYFTR
jgi:hypothetical protein